MPKEMLINVSEGEECRIALVEDGRLEELYMERSSSTSHVGNIYKGRVTNVEASIQAAFVDFGLGRNGFLHISDLMPTYFGRKGEDIQESVGRKMARRDRPPIQRCLRRGDEIIVQIIKEGIGTKGPTLSSYLSIPGRILVMMPGMANKGVSKKIEDDEERRRLRQILDGLQPPKDVGFIIRTAGIDKSKAEIQRDFTYLTRLWQMIEKKRDSGPGPMELYTEGDLVSRTVRDVYSTDVDTIVVDHPEVAKRVKDVIKLANPRATNKVELYEDPIPLFHKYGIEKDIELMHSRHVPLPSGGSLVIDSTEAVVAIDVNSGKFRDHSDAETTAFKTDMEAADEIPRQLRLRDLGGVIICDFIDLRYERHRRELEEKLHEKFKNDRAKTKVLRMSDFGIIEMTRQRMRPSLKRSIYSDCPHCKGAGLVKTPESMSLDVMRRLAIAAHDERVVRIELAVNPEAGLYLQNRKRAAIATLEYDTNKPILVRADATLALDEARFDLFDARDGKVFLAELGMTPDAQENPRRQTQQSAARRGGRDRGRQGGTQQGGRRDGRGDNRGGPQQQGRGHDDDDSTFERAEEDVDQREETREDDTDVPQQVPPFKPQPRGNDRAERPERPESYSNYTDNDVDLGEEENLPPPRPKRDMGYVRVKPVEPPAGAAEIDERGEAADEEQGNGQGDEQDNAREESQAPRQGHRQDPRQAPRRDQGGRQEQGRGRQQDHRGQQRNEPRGQQRNDQRGGQRGQSQGQPQRPPQGQSQRPPQGNLAARPAEEGQLFGQPGAEQGAGEGQEGGGRRRRRRRRGGRGRNRNRQEFNADGSPIPQQNEVAGQAGGDNGGDAGEAGDFEQAGDEPEDTRVEHDVTGYFQGRAEEARPEAREDRYEETPEPREPELTPEPEPVAEAPAEEESPKSRAKPKSRRKAAAPAAPKRPAAKSRGKKATAEPAPEAPAKPKRGGSRKKKSEPATPAAQVIEAAPVARTGSTDSHQLIIEESDEEPLVPSPVARAPRTYRDLDEIPDDLD